MTQQPPLNPRPLQIVRPWESQDKGMYRLIKAARQMGQQSSLVRAPQAWSGGNSVPSDVGQLGASGGGGGVSGSGTDNHIVRWDGTAAIQDSPLNLADSGAITTPLADSVFGYTAYDDGGTILNWVIRLGHGAGGIFAARSKDGDNILEARAIDTSGVVIYAETVTGNGTLDLNAPTTARTWTLPDATGTVALTSDIPSLTGYLTDTTPYTDFPDFGAAQRLLGSSDGGVTAQEIRTDATIDIISGIIGVAAGSIGTTQLANDAVTTAQLADLGAASRIHGSGSGSAAAIELIAERGLSIDADGIGLSFAAASRIAGSGSGGTTPIELVAERGLDIDANGIGISTGGVGNTELASGLAPQFATTTQTNTNYTVTATDHLVLVSTGNSTRTITLPLAANNIGRRIVVMKIDTGTGGITIARTSSDVINVRGNWGATSQAITNVQGAGAELIGQSSGNWLVLNTI